MGVFLSVKVSRKFEVRKSEPVRRKRVKGSHNRVEFGEFCKTVNRPGARLVRPKGTFPEELRGGLFRRSCASGSRSAVRRKRGWGSGALVYIIHRRKKYQGGSQASGGENFADLYKYSGRYFVKAGFIGASGRHERSRERPCELASPLWWAGGRRRRKKINKFISK